MVVFLDLDEDDVSDLDPHADPSEPGGYEWSLRQWPTKTRDVTKSGERNSATEVEARPDPNLCSCSAALGCYPYCPLLAFIPWAGLIQPLTEDTSIITQITAYIDLNTLHSLSLTCRQVRYNLLQYRRRLIQLTLRCENEAQDDSTVTLKPSRHRWHILSEADHLVSGKNCTLKPPALSRLPGRHRRLCPACLAAPLSALTHHDASSQTPCTCPSAIHLCASCGTLLDTTDTTYRRVWTWRKRYSTYLGGLGTGIGEGNEGVKCARGKECLGAKDVEVEFECLSGGGGSVSIGSESGGDGNDSPMVEKEEAGYWRQEIEGLGGIVKKKYRKRERVGGTVKEWEDEREGGEVLGREKRGEERSWCGWCGRVVLGGKDLDRDDIQ